ncbi:MAG TPA: hypothetical protein VNW93_01230, partial [Mycobacterium sp.]|nr:hypothetical protein [Mycobacterium sp.]
MRIVQALFVAVMLCTVAAVHVPASPAGPPSCESLAALALPHAKIDAVQSVAPGAFVAPAGRGREGGAGGRGASGRGSAPNPYADTPAFCRVSATLTPSADSDIKAEVWLPASGWNGK